MLITPKTAAVIAIVFAALFGGAWLILDRAVRPSFEKLEVDAHARDRARLEANLESISDDIRARTLDYARWDDTYAYVGRPNGAYIETNFPDSWFADYGADMVAFFRDNGQVIWARGRREDGAFENDVTLASAIMAQSREATLNRRAPQTGAIWAPGGPVLYAIAHVTQSSGMGQARGFAVIGRRLNSGALQQQTQLDLTFVATHEASPDLRARLAAAPQTWATKDHLRTLIPLAGGDGALTGAVLAQSSRELTALGARTITITLAMLTLMFAAVLGALWLSIRRMVIAPVERLERHIRAQSDQPAPFPHQGGRDETGRLANAYNDLTKRLAQAIGSERRAVEEREATAAASRMKSDFLANISHELRTPLNDVIGYAELIEEDLSSSGIATASTDLARITAAARRMLGLVNELYDLSRLESAQLDITPEPFDVEEMVQSAIDLIAPLARTQGNVLRLDVAMPLSEACSDQNRLRQCLVSVLAHACRRTHHGAVTFRAERTFGPGGGMLRFEICDGGPTLTRAQFAALFEPFDSSDEAKQASAARLGVAVARKLIVMLGGTLEAENMDGRGCRFVLTAPANMLTPDEPRLAA